MRMGVAIVWAWVAVGSVLLWTPRRASGQEDISLNAVESYLAHGRIEEARRVLESWLSTQGNGASRSDRQRSLWLRAKLTVDPSMAELDLRRLVLEYPGGPFSDDALFRLALFADARGELREAQSSFRELARNYPVSPYRRDAERWLAEHEAEEVHALLRLAYGVNEPERMYEREKFFFIEPGNKLVDSGHGKLLFV